MENKESAEKKENEGSDPKEGFASAFKAFCSFGDRLSDGTSITLKNIDKWLKQANILDGKKVTNADTAITFSKIAKTQKRLDQGGFEAFLEQLASDKGMTKEDLMAQLMEASEPGLSDVTKPVSGAAAAITERMTDTSQYTGSHRERFDAEGKGRGIEGREETQSCDGYVTGFKKKEEDKEKEEGKEKE